jgi:predicted lipid carrier protein YhbT
MSHARLVFPRPFAGLIKHLPTRPPSFALTLVLNLVLHEVIGRGDLQALYGKRISIHVTDAGLRLHFTVQPDGFYSTDSKGVPDLAISATMHDFTLLATRREDPDTLFFNRRLVVEGDTELGLVAKNTLDGIELPSATILAPGNVLSWLKRSLLRTFR